MLKKLLTATFIGVGALTMAMPAGAAAEKWPTVMHASFGAQGHAALLVNSKSYKSTIEVMGLQPGKYRYGIGVGDVSGEAGTSGSCTFTITARHRVGHCTFVSNESILTYWGLPCPPAYYRAYVDTLVGDPAPGADPRQLVMAADFS